MIENPKKNKANKSDNPICPKTPQTTRAEGGEIPIRLNTSIRLHSVKIKNFKSCVDTQIEDIPETGVTYLTGPNNQGKSNILKAVLWVFQPIKKGVTGVLHEDVSVELLFKTVASDNKVYPEYIIHKTKNKVNVAMLKEGQRTDLEGTSTQEWLRSNFLDPIYLSIEDSTENELGKHIKTNLMGAIASTLLSSNPEISEKVDKIKTDLKELADQLTGSFNEKASQLLRDTLGLNLDLRATESAYKPENLIFPELKLFIGSDKCIDDTGQDLCSHGTGVQRLAHLSTLKSMRDLASENSAQKFTVLLLDEPDAGLHPPLSTTLFEILEELAKTANIHIFIVTHSPFAVSASKSLHSFFKVFKSKENQASTNCYAVLNKTPLQKNSDHQKGQLINAEIATQVLFNTTTVLVEGKSEKIIPAVFKGLNRPLLSAAGCGIVSLDGCGNFIKFKGLLASNENTSLKIVADFDFVTKIIESSTEELTFYKEFNDVYVEKIKDALKVLAQERLITLSEKGFPCKGLNGAGNQIDAEAAWEIFCSKNKELVESIHIFLKKHGVWVWKSGAIEVLLRQGNNSVRLKTQKNIDAFLAKLTPGSIRDESAYAEFSSLYDWMLRNH